MIDAKLRAALSVLEPRDRGRRGGGDLADRRALARWHGGGVREEAHLPQRSVRRNRPRRALFPRRLGVHADLRTDAQRQSRARIALSRGRLYRLRGGGGDGLVASRI